MADILAAMQSTVASPEHKRARAAAATSGFDSKPAAPYGTMSLSEVSRVLLQHDQNLCSYYFGYEISSRQ